VRKHQVSCLTDVFSNREGFTLVEILTVVAIVGILATLAIPQFASYSVRGNNALAIADIKQLKIALEAFYSENTTYP
jgi:type IV pilus assembly protein PilA